MLPRKKLQNIKRLIEKKKRSLKRERERKREFKENKIICGFFFLLSLQVLLKKIKAENRSVGIFRNSQPVYNFVQFFVSFFIFFVLFGTANVSPINLKQFFFALRSFLILPVLCNLSKMSSL